VLLADSLTELQTMLPPGLERIERRGFDLPELVEVRRERPVQSLSLSIANSGMDSASLTRASR
jgi:hypothetical protein